MGVGRKAPQEGDFIHVVGIKLAAKTHSPDEIATAHHEAGHAAVALARGRPAERVSMMPNQFRLGHCKLDKGTIRHSRDLLDKTEYLLNQPGVWQAVERIAAELLQRTTISGRAARHLFEAAQAEAERDG